MAQRTDSKSVGSKELEGSNPSTPTNLTICKHGLMTSILPCWLCDFDEIDELLKESNG